MNGQNQDEDQEDHANHRKRPSAEQAPEVVAASPDGSQASHSSSTRRNAQRIVELLPELISRQTESNNTNGQDDWMIRAEFYDEDIGAEDERISIEIDEDEDDEDFDDELDEVDDLDHINEEVDEDDLDDDDMINMGYVLAPDIETSDSDGDELEDENDAADYDTTLPIGHRYLGDDLEESGGTQVFAENSALTLPLFNLRHIVLLPGQVLPIATTNDYMNGNIRESLKECLSRGNTLIGLITDPRENPIGTTAEIRNYHLQGEDVRLILEGRQRFQLLSQPFDIVNTQGNVKILPEVHLGRPYLLPSSHMKLLLNHSLKPGKLVRSRHPIWLLEKYRAINVVNRILDQIQNWCKVNLTGMTTNDFSFWVASNLPISNQERMKVLKFNCTEERLLWLLGLIERSEFFGCSMCKNVISSKDDVFTMSSAGPQNSFVNEGGYVHDTLTVRAAQGLIYEQRGWSTEFCWFPGYEWSIINCANCTKHIGWCYRSLSRETKPRKFYGLSRNSVRLQSRESNTTQTERSNNSQSDRRRFRIHDT